MVLLLVRWRQLKFPAALLLLLLLALPLELLAVTHASLVLLRSCQRRGSSDPHAARRASCRPTLAGRAGWRRPMYWRLLDTCVERRCRTVMLVLHIGTDRSHGSWPMLICVTNAAGR